MSLSDQLQHLWFPQLGVRGAYVRLQESLHDMPGHANGDANVRPLLGSAVAAAALLQGNLKSDTRLRLQLQGDHAAVETKRAGALLEGDGDLRLARTKIV